jgi:hypothetical protein
MYWVCRLLLRWHLYHGNTIQERRRTTTTAASQEWLLAEWTSFAWNRVKTKKEVPYKEELDKLAEIIKQAMFQDYKVAYSEEGDTHKEEALSTLTVGWLLKRCNFFLFRPLEIISIFRCIQMNPPSRQKILKLSGILALHMKGITNPHDEIKRSNPIPMLVMNGISE